MELADNMLQDLHEGICRSHTAIRAFTTRAISQGAVWPGMRKQAEEYSRKCDACQHHGNQSMPVRCTGRSSDGHSI
ncbi:hypothetical protein GIB67_013928 [Kingdonia uniflora]|uniref:Integrase zinc-binding domain-containing protein n=1 Tax=Kingdonia uniflora TaxID=39325 RepID=A0A7J7LDD9_9MAGN|nr:hypothetical protein GIB67_013928 [Kingdonia uniflora]